MADGVVRNANVRPEIGHRRIEADVAFSIARLRDLLQRVVVTLQRPNEIGLLRVRYRRAHHVILAVYSFPFHVTFRLNWTKRNPPRTLLQFCSNRSMSLEHLSHLLFYTVRFVRTVFLNDDCKRGKKKRSHRFAIFHVATRVRIGWLIFALNNLAVLNI